MIRLFESNEDKNFIREIKFQQFTFNGGEEQLFVKPADLGYGHYHIQADIESSKHIIQLLLLTSILRSDFKVKPKIYLFCPYFPYARQDRVMQVGEALSVAVIANLINSQCYDHVRIWDAHSDVTPALLKNVENVSVDHLIHGILKGSPYFKEDYVLVAPDAGAIKKITKVAQWHQVDMVRADKLRNVSTGEITETVVYSEYVGKKNFLIVDDICDGGRTFIELANKLRPLTHGKIYLYVTHGIFSQGFEVFEGKIDRIFCKNMFSSAVSKAFPTMSSKETSLVDYDSIFHL